MRPETRRKKQRKRQNQTTGKNLWPINTDDGNLVKKWTAKENLYPIHKLDLSKELTLYLIVHEWFFFFFFWWLKKQRKRELQNFVTTKDKFGFGSYFHTIFVQLRRKKWIQF